MKQNFTQAFFLMLCCFSFSLLSAQTNKGPFYVKQVVVAEYKTWYIRNDGVVYAYSNLSAFPIVWSIGGRTAVMGAGGFNILRVLDDQGYIWSSAGGDNISTVRLDKDASGNAFNNNVFVDAYANTVISIRTDGSVWYWGNDSYNLFNTGGVLGSSGSGVVMKPTKLSPSGLKFKKVLLGGNRIIGLTTAGQVYVWNPGNRTPVLKTVPRAAVDIFVSHLDIAGCIVPDAGESSGLGYPYVLGTTTSMYGGGTAYSQFTSLKALWKMTVPVKEICASWNTIHYIDSLGRMFGCGFNSQGEVGNGQEFVNKYTYSGFPGYGWTFTDYENPSGIPVEIGAGTKWSHLYSNNWFSFYKYAQDANDSLYSWGRNKSLVLGNGFYNMQEAASPDAMDVLKPTMVHPLTARYQQYSFKKPSISATATVSGTTATLTGTATAAAVTSNGTNVNGIAKMGYTIASYAWTKVSGNGGTITSPGSATTTVTGLTPEASYVFQLVTTDNNTGTQMTKVTVKAGSAEVIVPVANAGTAQTITLPTNSVTLSGTGTEKGKTITIFSWVQKSGPSTAVIGSATSASTTVSGLVQGVYVFVLTVTDPSGVKATSTVQVTVNAAAVTTSASNWQAVPGTVQAESYVGTIGTHSQTTTDSGGGENVGWLTLGSWLSYNVNVATAGTYTIKFRVATENSGCSFKLSNGTTVLATVAVPNTGSYTTYQTVTATVTLPAGHQTLTVSALSQAYWNFNWMEFDTGESSSSRASGTAGKTIPGKIEAEDYDATVGTHSQTTTDTGGGDNVGWLTLGSWLSYQVTVTTAGTYTASFRVATINSACSFNLKNSSGTVLATVNVPNTGSYTTYQTVNATVTLPAGAQTLTISSNSLPYWNLNWMQFATSTGASSSSTTTDAASGKSIPGTIQAENYDATIGTQVQATTDAGGGDNVGWLTLGSWLSYNVTVATAGTYTVGFRVASVNSGCSLNLTNGTGTVLTTVSVPNTGGYSTYQTVSATVVLPAGSQTIKVVSNTSPYFNLNWMVFSSGKASTSTGGDETAATASKWQSDSTGNAALRTYVTLYPNPAHDNINLDISNEHFGKVNILIVDQSGHTVRTYNFVKDISLSHLTLTTNGLAIGTYYIRIQMSSWNQTLKLLKI